MSRVLVKPELLSWARERSGRSTESLNQRFPKLDDWLREKARPTLKQLEAFAKATHAPIGFFFLPKPPIEKIPIPDFRTAQNVPLMGPSPDLLDTIYLCQQRQEWFRDYARSMGESPLAFVGSARVGDDVVRTADLFSVKSSPEDTMIHRAKILSITQPGCPIDTDHAFLYDVRDNWIDIMQAQLRWGIPCLYHFKYVWHKRPFVRPYLEEMTDAHYAAVAKAFKSYWKKLEGTR